MILNDEDSFFLDELKPPISYSMVIQQAQTISIL